MTVTIRLTWPEVMTAAQIGCMRNVQSLRRPPGNGAGLDNTWTLNIEGTAGEMALAKYLGAYWSGAVGDLKACDVGGFQVRTNISRRLDDLILRDTDADNDRFVLVLSFLPDFHICGWIKGSEGKRPEWKRDGTPGRPPAFFVPRSALHSLSTLGVAA